MTGPIRIATRRSRLALWQAEQVAARIAALRPGHLALEADHKSEQKTES